VTKVKICGITNLEDALTAVEAGADYLGFIFYPPSKRAISLKKAHWLVSNLRTLPNCPLLVGVFVDETAEYMAHVLDLCQLDLAQLSGNEVPSLVGDEKSAIYGRAYKALRPSTFAEAEADAEWYIAPLLHEGQPALLMETYHPTLFGGTGETGDWHIGAQLAQQIPRFMLAGGLTAANVATAVQQVQPYAVDVASGIEASPGKKDPELVRAFIANAKS
jgi:phosphoribosylanthranilate isomerase